MRREAQVLLSVVALGLAAPRAAAQPFAAGGGGMPNLRAISGQPLPDQGMAAGTVSVRVARKIPANAVAGVEVVAITKNAGGDLRKRTAKTDAGGRALFESLAPGDEFHAEVTVDGESLKTVSFPIPAQGGVRTMLIAALGPASAEEAPSDAAAAGSPAFAIGSTTGSARADASLPAKTLEVTLIDENGRPIPNHPVTLGSVDTSNKVEVRHAQSNASGVARFTDLPTGKTTGYAAVTDWKGMHIGTGPFAMPEDGGTRAEIHALERTSDPSVITIGEGARIILQMREDTLQFLEILPLENNSPKLFDPGPGAIEIPLPAEFTGAEAGQGDHKLEIRQNRGVAIHGVISPKSTLGDVDAKTAGNEVSFGFVMPYHGDAREFVQPVPTGIGLFTLITEQIPGLQIAGTGVGARASRELNGRKYWVMPGAAVAPGGVISFTVTGLPSTDHTGRTVAGVLTLALIGAAIAFGRRPKGEARKAAVSERDRLTARREILFAELVSVERQARSGVLGATPERRRELVGKLEGVYQQLAALEEQRAP
ncbi:MAG TPA: hypothetical protein VGK52_01810 [Polyangia bacterium]|jgi:hypothetical protein